MSLLILLIIVVVFSLSIGSVLGYFARQSIARKQSDTIETTLRKKIIQTKKTAEEIMLKAQVMPKNRLKTSVKKFLKQKIFCLKEKAVFIKKKIF